MIIRNLVAAVLAASVLCSIGCKKDIQSSEAVKAGIVKHLSKNAGISLDSMEFEVSNITFRENEADAVVSFRPKGGDASSGMQMRYTLVRQNDEWQVKKKADSGNPHAAGPGSISKPAQESPSPDLPPNHPPMGDGTSRK